MVKRRKETGTGIKDGFLSASDYLQHYMVPGWICSACVSFLLKLITQSAVPLSYESFVRLYPPVCT